MLTKIIFFLHFALLAHNLPDTENFGKIFSEKTGPNLVFAGDVMLSRSVGAMTKTRGVAYITKDYNPFSEAKNGDFVLMNLESPFSYNDRDTHEPSFYFASNIRNIEVLKNLTRDKIAVISLANNHIFNASYEGFETTLKLLDEAKIHHTGLSKGERQKFLEIFHNDEKYCFGAYSYDGREYFDKKNNQKYFVNSLTDAEKDIFEMQKSECDKKIFILHWGAEYVFEPSEKQKKLAYLLVDNGADVIIGAHSHIFGKYEKYKNSWIFYSLGNAIFDQEWGRDGCEANMHCVFDEKLQKQVVPTHIGTAGELVYPYVSEPRFWHWDIRVGNLKKR